MKRIVLLVLVGHVFSIFAFAQPQHFTFKANTGDSYSIVVSAATLDSVALKVGDEIGVFTPAAICVGASVWDGNTPLALVAWIDDSQTIGTDGYTPGDSIFFRIWQQSSDEEFGADPSYTQGNGTFGNGAFAQVSLAAVSGGSAPGKIVVTNTNDSGEGSLRQAIKTANIQAGPDTIIFNIQQNDPGFRSDSGTWTIQPLNPLPAISDSELVVDGRSQADFIGMDANPDGPEIVINGSRAGSPAAGLQILSSQNVIQHLVINGFSSMGILIFGENAYDNEILGNYIGTTAAGDSAVPNNIGIYITEADFNIIGGSDTAESNLISGNKFQGIALGYGNADYNVIIGNLVGTDAGGTKALPNGTFGLSLFNGSQHNVIGPGNRVAHNGSDGVLVDGADNLGSTVSNTITANSITANGGQGIHIMRGGNKELTQPINIQINGSAVSGNAPPNAIVEIFSDDDDEGQIYEGTTTADANGNFQWNGTLTGPFVTATATDADGNTSQFSQPEDITAVSETAESTLPQEFSLSQNYPNPFNPTTTINYAVPVKFAGGVKVSFKIFNIKGQMVRSLMDENQSPGFYSVVWDGKNEEGRKASSGLYVYTVSMGEFQAAHKMILLQ